jgi:hypothetical protein
MFLPGSLGMCEDGIRNGGETGVDCGGKCPPCSSSAGGISVVVAMTCYIVHCFMAT